MNLSTEKVDDIKLQDHPRGVCTVSKNEAAVALYNNSVQFVSLGDRMVATRTLTMDHTCFGLAYNDVKLFTYDQSNTMYIYDINGQQQHKFTLDGLSSNLSPGSATYYVVRASGDRVYIAHHNKGLIVLDNQGNYISTKSHNNNSGYKGVCTGGGNIFVSVTSTNKIVQIGPDLELLGELCNLENNSLLCFDPQKRSLIAVALGSGKIKIIELE